ncbi:hypothetical protein AgCh_017415 [Apium graveolens]
MSISDDGHKNAFVKGETILLQTDLSRSNTVIPRSIKWHDISLPTEWVLEGVAHPRLPERLEPNTQIHQVQDDNGRVTLAFDRSSRAPFISSRYSDASSRTLNLGRISQIPSIINTSSRPRPYLRNTPRLAVTQEYKFCTYEPKPDQPAADAPEDEKEYYKRWIKADEMSRCYILAAMSDVLQHQHQSMATASDMLFNLKELFGDQNRAARQVAMKALMNTQMAEGTPVRDHVLKMMSHLNEIEILGAELDGETQIDIILMSLSKSFEQFRLNYNMNKRQYSLAELLTELQAAEGLFRQSVQVNVAEKGSSSKPKGIKKKKKAQTQKAVKAVGVQGGVKKPKGKCFRCKQSGHWKQDCPLPTKTNNTGMSLSLVTETFIAAISTSTWCVDTGATDHVCNSMQGFRLSRMLRDGEIYVFMGDATKVAVVAVGVIHLSFSSDRILVLNNCLYVPSFRRNLISVSKLALDGYNVCLDRNVSIMMNKRIICSGTLQENLYIINPSQPALQLQFRELNNTSTNSNKRKEPSSMNQTYLWHLRLGHINLRRIQRLVVDEPLSSLAVEPFPVCESCLEGKMTNRPFKAKGNRAKQLLELVHSDLCGPMNIQARGGYEYFVTFIDDYSRYGYVYLLRRLSALISSKSTKLKRRSDLIKVSSHYDQIVVANTCLEDLGNIYQKMG